MEISKEETTMKSFVGKPAYYALVNQFENETTAEFTQMF